VPKRTPCLLARYGLAGQPFGAPCSVVAIGAHMEYSNGSSSWRVGDFHLFSDRIKHAREDLEAQVLFVA
jgi:hypothetical protein